MEDIEKDMKPRFIKDLGMRKATEKSSRKYRYGLFQCQYCGKEFEAQSSNIKHGLKSCGCQRKGINKTHGLRSHRLYHTWNNMIQRCTNPNHKAYKDYGARGITICGEWLDVKNFIEWCDQTYIEGMTLDRIDNNKGYNPDNCRWVSKSEQAINRRMKSINTSGYVGVIWDKRGRKWRANIGVNNKVVNIGSFSTLENAVQARDNYIIENKLPHKLSILNTGLKDKR